MAQEIKINTHDVCNAEFIKKDFDLPHPPPHQHGYYELYFLHSGRRDVFIDNQMYSLTDNCLAIIPPYCYHKTEGQEYARTNLSFQPYILNDKEQAFLNELEKQRVVIIADRHLDIIYRLLAEADGVRLSNAPFDVKHDRIAQIIKTVLMFLSMQNNHPLPPVSATKHKQTNRKNTTAEMLRVAQYINNNYTHKITLDDICKKFLISKTALNLKFQDVMQCTVVEYILSVRLNHATYLLTHTRRSIEEISQDCGFSSANYFGLIFKKKMGNSPAYYQYANTNNPRRRKQSRKSPPKNIK